MAGSVLVFLAIAGGAVFASAMFQRRVAEMVPFSLLFLIGHTMLCAQIGLLRFSVYAGVFGMIGLGAAGLWMGLRRRDKRPRWDSSLVLFGLSFIWLVYISQGRMPQQPEDYTQWALMAKTMFYSGSLTPAAGTLAYPPAMAVFQTIFQVSGSLFAPGAGFADWLLYVACGTACLALLLPLAACAHPNRWVRAGYTLLFFLVAVCLPLQAFDLFSALHPDGLLAILAAMGFLAAAKEKSLAQAWIVGTYLFVLVLIKDAGMLFALGALVVYLVTLPRAAAYREAGRKRRTLLTAVPVGLMVLARASWPHAGFALHGATPGVLPLFWQSVTAKTVTLRAALTAGGSTWFSLFTVYASPLALLLALLGITALLLRALRARETGRNLRTALWLAPAVTLLYMIGVWLAYVFAISAGDAAKLVNVQRLLSVGTVFWGLIVLAAIQAALAQTKAWPWRRHLLTILVCLCVVLMGSGALDTLTSRNFTAANEKYYTYYAVADTAQTLIPQDARVYIVSQNDDGTRYDTLRYALCPRPVNPDGTYWLREPQDKQNEWTYPVTPRQWREQVREYDYVLVYQADDYVQTAIAEAVTADAVIAANTIYRVDRDTGLLQAVDAQN